MNWSKYRGKFSTTSNNDQIDFVIIPKTNGNFFVKAYLEGGTEHRLPFQDFETAQAAMDWVEQYEIERAADNARYAQEEPIRF